MQRRIRQSPRVGRPRLHVIGFAAALLLSLGAPSVALATCGNSGTMCCQGNKRMTCSDGAATGVFDTCGGTDICLSTATGVPECSPVAVASYFGYYSAVPYCSGSCRVGCVGGWCHGDCPAGTVCNDGTCETSKCGTLYQWHNAAEGDTNTNPIGTVAPADGLRSICSSSVGWGIGVRNDGSLTWWGNGDYYTGGPGSYSGVFNAGLNNIKDAVQVACMRYSVMVLRKNGTIAYYGQATNNEQGVTYPTGIPAYSNIVAIAAADYAGAVLDKDGKVSIFGFEKNNIYAALKEKTGYKAIGGGGGGFIGIKADGTVTYASGDKYGNAHPAPTGLTNIVQATLGASGQGIALQADGTVVVFGNGPTAPTDLKKAVAVAAETSNTFNPKFFALQVDGKLRVWGGYGTLPDIVNPLTNIHFVDPHGRAALGCPDSNCGAVSQLGCCDGDKVYRCSGGKLVSEGCAAGKCGWNTTGGATTCDTNGGAVEGNYHLKSCICVPNCEGKQCGSDGCGGTCDKGSCDDGNGCTADDKCNGENCVGTTSDTCDDNNPCTDDSCTNEAGKAVCKNVAKAGPCDDGDPCQTGDACDQGTCKPGTKQLDCDDADPCTDDSCEAGKGCKHVNNTASCNDGDACTVVDTCENGKCGAQPGEACASTDTSDLTLKCDAGTITKITWADYGIATGTCPNFNFYGCACSLPKYCSQGAAAWIHTQCVGKASCTLSNPHVALGDPCVGKAKVLAVKFECDNKDVNNIKDCDDANPCTDDSCDPKSGCLNVNSTKACDDGSTCTESSTCKDGQCVGSGLDCDDGNPCTIDNCSSPTECAPKVNVADGTKCSDGNKCHTTGSCSTGACTGLNDVTCDDGNLCTDDSCDPKTGCVFTANTAKCSDGDACTEGDVCAAKACKAGSALVCNDGDFCTTDSCDKGKGCVYPFNTASCDDGNKCTLNDACSSGKCIGEPKTCEDGNVCTADNCNPQLDCQHALRNVACEDGDTCTKGDSCQGGVCKAGVAPPCNDGNACTDDSCDPKTGCTYTPNAAPCNDKNPCTVGDVCSAAACTPGSGKANCNDLDPCTNDSCNSTVGCVHLANTAPCDDGNSCTSPDICKGGSCVGNPKGCDDGNPCTDDSCLGGKGCVSTPKTGASCDDGKKCTTDDACKDGVCQGNASAACDDGDPCTQDYCFESISGGCYHNPFPADGQGCDDGNPCTVEGKCVGGKCQSKAACLTGGCSVVLGKPFCGCGDNQVQRPSGAFLYCCNKTCAADSVCGDDGCGGTCGNGCTSDEYCTDDRTACLPKLACYGQAPVDVGCCDGRIVRSCSAPSSLTTEDCSKAGAFCGWDAAKGRYGCTSTGLPAPDAAKHPFACPKADACVPDCKGRTCGPDGCGGSCGTCAGEGEYCATTTGTCAKPCGGVYPLHGCVVQQSTIDVITYCPAADSPAGAATQVQCGQGVKAGWSASEKRFVCGGKDTPPSGTSAECAQACTCGVGVTAANCGTLQCGVTCGTCESGSTCVDYHCCKPDCEGRECGDDGCGGSCGSCKGSETCLAAGVCSDVDCGGVDHDGTCDGNVVKFCGPWGQVQHDCGGSGLSCGTLPGSNKKGCLTVAPTTCAADSCTTAAGASCSCAADCVEKGNCCDNFDWTCGAKASGSCGDGVCRPEAGESCETCAGDCGACQTLVADKHVLPYPLILRDAKTPAASAVPGVGPLDDVRPSPPPLPRDGLLTHVLQRGVTEGSPRTGVLETAFDLDGKVVDVAKGKGGAAIGVQQDGKPLGGGLSIRPGRLLNGAASFAEHSRGGFTVAGWVRTPKAGRKYAMALGAAYGIRKPDVTNSFGPPDREACGVARPGDTNVQISCGPGKSRIASIQVYWGHTAEPVWPAPAGMDACAYADTLPRTYACGGDVSAAFASVIGKTSATIDPWAKLLDPCVEKGTKAVKSSLVVRAICRPYERPAELSLSVDEDAAGGRLRLVRREGSTLLATDEALPADAWVHVAVAFEPLTSNDPWDLSTGRLGLYIDGTLRKERYVSMMASYQWVWGAGRHPRDTSVGGGISSWPNFLEKDVLAPLADTWQPLVRLGAIADFDDLFHYDRALSAAELRTLQAGPSSGLLRVWPAQTARVVAQQSLWTLGGKVAAVPVTLPDLQQRRADGKAGPLRASFDAIAPATGATTRMPADGVDLEGLDRWTLAAWLSPRKVGAGTTLLALQDDGNDRLAVRLHAGCGGRALEVVFPDGSSLQQTDCSHLLSQDRFSFVSVIQDATGRRVAVDGATTSGSGKGALFAAGGKARRVLTLTDSAALGWAALYRRALTADDEQAQRGQGPVVWLDGAVLQTYEGRTGVPRDLAAFHNEASDGATDHVSAYLGASKASGAAANFATNKGYVQIPARGRLQPLLAGATRHFSVLQTLLFDATTGTEPKGAARPLAQLVAGGKDAAQAWLQCESADNSKASGFAHAVACKLFTARRGASGSASVHASPTFTVNVKAWPVSVRVAVSISSAPRATIAALPATSAAAAVALGTELVLGGDSVALPLTAATAPTPALSTTGADALYVPGRLDGTGGTTASVGFAAISDVRVYARALDEAELGLGATPGCANLGCDKNLRTCGAGTIASGTSGLVGTSVAMCGACQADAYELLDQCRPKVQMDRACQSDAECLTGRCNNAGDGLGEGVCVMKASEAEACKAVCLTLGRTCYVDEKKGDAQCYVCEKYFGGIPNAGIQLPEMQDGVGRCKWNPQIPANEPCEVGYGCLSGLCIERVTPVYDVTANVSIGDGRYKRATANFGANVPQKTWLPAGPTEVCNGKGCAKAKKSSATLKVCAAQTMLACDSLNRQQSLVTGKRWDGETVSGYRCDGCQSIAYSGQNLYRESYRLLEPRACATMYDNWFDLQEKDARGRTGVKINNQFYVSEWPHNQTPKQAAHYETGLNNVSEPSPAAKGDILDQPATEAIVRRLILKDPDTTKPLQPAQVSAISAAGVGVDLLGWEFRSPAQDYATRKMTSGNPKSKGAGTFSSHFPIGACLVANSKWANFSQSAVKEVDGKDAWGQPAYKTVGVNDEQWQDTYHSPYFDPTVNQPVCAVNKYPDGTVCPPPGQESKFTRSNAGLMCISGFCAADTGRCEEGYTWYEEVHGQGRKDGKKGSGDKDLGSFGLDQDHGSTMRFDKVAKTIPLQAGTTDHRHFFLEAHSTSTATMFGKSMEVLNISMQITTNPGADKVADRASFKNEFLVFGIVPPTLPIPALPSLSCSGAQFKNGELQSGVSCKPIRKQISVSAQVEAEKGGKTYATNVLNAGGADTAPQNLVDTGAMKLASFEIPLPLAECPDKDGLSFLTAKLCFQKKVTAGPVPLKVTAELAPEVNIAFGLELDSDTFEPAFVITPSVGLGIEVKGGLDLWAVFAGIYGSLTIVEAGVPIAFGIGFRKGIKQSGNSSSVVTDLWKLDRVIRTDLSLTFLKLALGVFFEIGIDPLKIEISHEFISFGGINFTWTLGKPALHTDKVDFAYDILGDKHSAGLQ